MTTISISSSNSSFSIHSHSSPSRSCSLGSLGSSLSEDSKWTSPAALSGNGSCFAGALTNERGAGKQHVTFLRMNLCGLGWFFASGAVDCPLVGVLDFSFSHDVQLGHSGSCSSPLALQSSHTRLGGRRPAGSAARGARSGIGVLASFLARAMPSRSIPEDAAFSFRGAS